MKMVNKIQFVFCAHTSGHLARENEVQPQPPLGLLTLASYVRHVLHDVEVEVFDGKFFSEEDLLQVLDADLVGFSVWFSNYARSISLASKVKASRPNTVIVMGGPHATAIAGRILKFNDCIDFVVRGEGEIPFSELLKGQPPEKIPGLVFRSGKGVCGMDVSPHLWEKTDLSSPPMVDLDLLRPAYQWQSNRGGPAMSAFPLSGVRGCFRSDRCEYCSIPTMGYRAMAPEKYWTQITKLNEQHEIDYFFETGDTFPRRYLTEVTKVKQHPEGGFR